MLSAVRSTVVNHSAVR